MTHEKFWSKVDANGDCWEWTATRTYNGYGWWATGRHLVGTGLAHRIAWLLLVGPIPDGLTIDHLCTNRKCVNPDHLEPVTQQVNMSRARSFNNIKARSDFTMRDATTGLCKQGHAMSGDNLYVNGGKSYCRRCRADWQLRNRAKIAAKWR